VGHFRVRKHKEAFGDEGIMHRIGNFVWLEHGPGGTHDVARIRVDRGVVGRAIAASQHRGVDTLRA
ncbi:MAG: hypothetical protein RLZZ332_778, partial [Actinomycetota bacterium]